jgi:transmembrane sensor
MGSQDISRDIDDIAANWVVRIDRGSLSEAEQQELETWLNADPRRHQGAFARAHAIFIFARRAGLGPLGDGVNSPASEPGTKAAPTRRHVLWGASAAAAVAITAGVGLNMRAGSYSTQRGEVRLLPLSDGSVVTLNTNSEIIVSFGRTNRSIQLLRGEALFDVVKDTKRPFIVTASDTVVRAVGTSFAVRSLQAQPVQVLVREGAVDMFRQVQEASPLRVPAHARAVALEVPFPSVKLVDVGLDETAIARYLAWRQGMISFEGESLNNAVAEFNRYSDVQITVDDPTIAGRTVTGLFSIHNPVGFARSVAVSLNLKIEIAPNRVMLWQ